MGDRGVSMWGRGVSMGERYISMWGRNRGFMVHGRGVVRAAMKNMDE